MKEINITIEYQTIPSPNDLIELKSEDIVTNVNFNEVELKEYNKEQCVYGKDSTMTCEFCSATCPERYKDFKEKGVRMTWIDKNGNIVDY